MCMSRFTVRGEGHCHRMWPSPPQLKQRLVLFSWFCGCGLTGTAGGMAGVKSGSWPPGAAGGMAETAGTTGAPAAAALCNTS